MSATGKVYIIGGGPGDPGLITLRGIRCLERSDLVVYDHLVNEELLNHAPTRARRVYVGKQSGDHTVSQEDLNSFLVKEARKGAVVARLKGGDPFVFGRGGEEALVLAREGVPFEIVSGVSSAVAVPSYAGIPLTQRHYTSIVALVTGHEDPNKPESRLHWEHLAPLETLVFLMAVKNLPLITEQLIAHGKNPETPAALIRWGTLPDQETVTGSLGEIAEIARRKGVTPPAIFVVGEVASLRDQLSWFENKPLFGRGIVITRPEQQAGEMADLLRDEGARVILFPVIEVAPAADLEQVDRALRNASTYQWIIFTSANSVRFFFGRLKELGMDVRQLKGPRIAAIGPATAAAVKSRGLTVDIVPGEYLSEGVIQAFETIDVQGSRVLLPRAEQARDVIPDGLASRGAVVDVVPLYRTTESARDGSELVRLMSEGRVDLITFTSPSTVRHCIKKIGGVDAIPPSVRIACIGPVTAEAARDAGLRVDILQGPYDISGFVNAIVEGMEGIP